MSDDDPPPRGESANDAAPPPRGESANDADAQRTPRATPNNNNATPLLAGLFASAGASAAGAVSAAFATAVRTPLTSNTTTNKGQSGDDARGGDNNLGDLFSDAVGGGGSEVPALPPLNHDDIHAGTTVTALASGWTCSNCGKSWPDSRKRCKCKTWRGGIEISFSARRPRTRTRLPREWT